MRRDAVALFLLGVLAAVPPPALASSRVPEWRFDAAIDGVPFVNETVRVTLQHLPDGGDGEWRFALVVPEWVEVEGSPEWTVARDAGRAESHAWSVRATRPGTWALSVDVLNAGDSRWRAWCCAVAYSDAAAGGFADASDLPHARDAALGTLPEARAESALRARAFSPWSIRAEWTVEPDAEWMRFGTLQARFTEFDLHGGGVSGPGDASLSAVVHALLDPGENRTVTAEAWLDVAFEGWDAPFRVDVACASHRYAREEDSVRLLEASDCGRAAERADHAAATAVLVPREAAAPPGIVAAACGLGAAILTRGRGRRA